MKNWLLYIVILLFSAQSSVTYAQEQHAQKVEWNGYAQLRFTSNFSDVNSFSMRRMKLWVNSAPGFSEHWGFHVQTTITSLQNEKFFLQDVMAFYKQGQFRVNMGQFVPEYSLQRFQPDYEIPLTERANVINALIPNGTLGVRDIGIEGKYTSPNKNVETWLGIFNGNGIKEYRLNNSGILVTHKTAFHLFNEQFTTGYSAIYRKADQLQLVAILPDSVKFSGNDFRYNLFAQYQSKKIQIQAEYLWADLDNKIADGYYILAALNLGKNQLVTSWNQYNDLIESTDNSPIVHLAYNYLVNGDKLKIMFDNGVQISNGSLKNYFATIQLQISFN
jgi:hypothetical protein